MQEASQKIKDWIPMAPAELFDILCARISREGRGARLMGNLQPMALKAVSGCLIDDKVPVTWFEFPLLGRPRFDLHVILSAEALSCVEALPPALAQGSFGEALRWMGTNGPKDGGVAFAFDLSAGRTDSHGLHFICRKAMDIEGSFSALGAPDASKLLRDFNCRIPVGWRMWYFGLLTGRTGRPVRADFYVDDNLKARYADSPELFAEHLGHTGFTAVSDTLLTRMKEIAASPFCMELQFDILEDGTVAPTIGLSADMNAKDPDRSRRGFPEEERNAASEIFGRLEALGLSDDRWQLFLESFFAKQIVFGPVNIQLVHSPIFLKQRFRDGNPLDAKVYSEAMVREIIPEEEREA